jgi:hypothetical protein
LLSASLLFLVTVAVACAGLVELGAQGGRAATLVDRGTARGLLGAAQLDIGQGQIQMALALGSQTPTDLEVLPKALSQHQKGVDE